MNEPNKHRLYKIWRKNIQALPINHILGVPWWKILVYHSPQFIYESKSECVIEIGPHLPKLS